jgi:spore coat protein CotH
VWYQASNYYLNQDMKTNQWVMISYDFDETFGNGAEKGRDSVAYQNYSRPGFENILKTLVKRFFNPRVIQPRLEAWATLLKEDIEWDYSIPGHSPGDKNTYTVQNFLKNLNTTDSQADMEGINQWITTRAKTLTQQLNFNDNDDLPALGPYKQGSRLDASGNVVPNDGSSVSPGGSSGSSNGGDGKGDGDSSGAASLTISSLLLSAMVVIGTLVIL